MTTRRGLLLVIGAASLAPTTSFAQQQAKIARIGFIGAGGGAEFAGWVEAFRAGLRDLGYFEGKNLAIQYSWAEGSYGRLPGLAAELVRSKVDVIMALGTPAVGAAQKATTRIPIVMANVSDPITSGFVKTLVRPGSNITGISNIIGDLSHKHLEMILSIAPRLTCVAVLMNPNNAGHAASLAIKQSAEQKTNVKILRAEVRTPQEIETAFSRMTRDKAGAVIILGDAVFIRERRQIAELAAKHRLLSIDPYREYAEAGGLMSYGADQVDMWRRAASHVDRILRGASPSDLPVELPTKFELVINMKTAKALGITIPQSILVRADRVIE